MITKREAAIISTYTGILLGDATAMREYIAEIMGRPVYTHDMRNAETYKIIKEKAKKDFVNLHVE